MNSSMNTATPTVWPGARQAQDQRAPGEHPPAAEPPILAGHGKRHGRFSGSQCAFSVAECPARASRAMGGARVPPPSRRSRRLGQSSWTAET